MRVNFKQIIDFGGGIHLLKHNSLSQLLSSIFPEFNRKEELDIWHNEHLAIYFVEWLKKQPNKQISSVSQIVSKKLQMKGNFLTLLLSASFPEYQWNVSLSHGNKKSQYKLKECIQTMFNKDALLLEEYKHPQNNIEFDYFLPQFNLAFEYQVYIEIYN